MPKQNEYNAADSLAQAAEDAKKRRAAQLEARPKLPIGYSGQEKVVLTVIAVLGALFVSAIGFIGCMAAGWCK